MFIANKYTNWYYQIISRAKNRKLSGYSEKHHIIPRSLGGDNSKENIVCLTAREHFICHLLLIRMLSGIAKSKMVYASWCLANQENAEQFRYKINGNTYAQLRATFSDTHSQWMKENHSLIDEKVKNYWTEENRKTHAEKISKVTKGRILTELHKEKLRNKTWTEKALENRLTNCLVNARKRKGLKDPEHGKKIFIAYVNKNKEIIKQVLIMHDNGLTRRKIAIQLNISWDRVNTVIKRRSQIDEILEKIT